MNSTSPRARLRSVLNGKACVYCPSVFDPISARSAAQVGFETSILGGSVAALAVLGAPDANVLTLSEFVEHARRICRASTLPLIADADHGYGNALNVIRCVQELSMVGVAAITIEDTRIPRPYRGGSNVDLIEIDEAVGKLNAALMARSDADLSIIARTHAGGTQHDNAILARVKAYADTGVDALCLTGVRSRAQLEAIAAQTCMPILLITYGGKALGDPAELAAAGVRLWVDGHAPYLAAVQATYRALQALRDGEHAPAVLDAVPPMLMAQLNQQADYDRWTRDFLGGQ